MGLPSRKLNHIPASMIFGHARRSWHGLEGPCRTHRLPADAKQHLHDSALHHEYGTSLSKSLELYDEHEQYGSTHFARDPLEEPSDDLEVHSDPPNLVTELSADEAKAYFLRGECYCSLDLPPYFEFGNMLSKISNWLTGKKGSDVFQKPYEHENVNYTLFNNKDGQYAWRPLSLVHPVAYVELVHTITAQASWKQVQKRLQEFRELGKIDCASIPVVPSEKRSTKGAQILNWWQEVEQEAIQLALDYEFVHHSDITDCYGSIYTHSVAWAIHGKQEAKDNKKKKSWVGNAIDRQLQHMRHGQTNGIPQGPVLMDLIAELVLGYVDCKLATGLNSLDEKGYQILRYRDDYRVFTNNPRVGDRIIKELSSVLAGFGMRLNPSKTKASNDVIRSSVKADKLHWNRVKQHVDNEQKQLLLIYDLAQQYPNSGSLLHAMTNFHDRLLRRKPVHQVVPLVSLVADIGARNPRVWPMTAAILSKLLSCIANEQQRRVVFDKVKGKMSKLANKEFMEVWLQRVSLPNFSDQVGYESKLCQLVSGKEIDLWNSDWIGSPELKDLAKPALIVNKSAIKELNPVVSLDEVSTFYPY